MTRFRTLRGRLTALAVLAAFVALAALTVAFNVLLARSLDADGNRRLRSQAAAASTTVVHRGGRARRADRRLHRRPRRRRAHARERVDRWRARQVGTVVVAEPLEAYEHTRERALLARSPSQPCCSPPCTR